MAVRKARGAGNGANIRLAADIGGTFTDIAAFDDKTGRLHLRQGAVDAATGWSTASAAASRRPAATTPTPACSCTARPSRSTPSWSAPAPRPRWSSPRASATSTRSAASTGPTPTICISRSTCRWSSARCASRCNERVLRRRRGLTSRSTRQELAALGDKLGQARHRSGRDPVPQLLRAIRAHEARAKAILSKRHPEHVRLGLARTVAGISRVRALLDRGRQRLYRAEGAPLHRRDRRAHPQAPASTARS